MCGGKLIKSQGLNKTKAKTDFKKYHRSPCYYSVPQMEHLISTKDDVQKKNIFKFNKKFLIHRKSKNLSM